jgi:hypothetical protein
VKNLYLRVVSDYGGAFFLYQTDGSYVGVDSTLDLSTEPGWQSGDTLHYEDESGEMWITDSFGEKVTLRVAVNVNNTLIENWGLILSWLHYIGFSFWRGNVGAYVWQDQNEVYTPGIQVQGEDTRGYLHPVDFARFSDTYTKAEIDAMFAALANQ